MPFRNGIARIGSSRYLARVWVEGKLHKATFHSLREAERFRDTLRARRIEKKHGIDLTGGEVVIFRQTHVYFFQAGNGGPIKIGTAMNITERLAALQSGAPYRLMPLGFAPGGELLELLLHERFAAHRIADREWFYPVPELLEFIEKHTDRTGTVVKRGRRRVLAMPVLRETPAVYGSGESKS